MMHSSVITPEQALVYMTDCTLATVEDMAKEHKGTPEYERQIGIAQYGCNWLEKMHIDLWDTRANDIIGKTTVKEWAKQYE